MYERPYSQGKDGIWRDTEGNPVDKDLVYAEAFWKMKREQLPGKYFDDFEKIIKEGIEVQARESGTVGSLVSNNGLTEEDKMKLSAVRITAKSMGYEVGEFQYNDKSGTATAPIKKIKQ